jgi:hypothetical protein
LSCNVWIIVFCLSISSLCKLITKLNLNDIGRSHPIGQSRDGKISIIVRFLTYRQRAIVFSNKKKLKWNKDNIFICENLTKHRYDILKRLNTWYLWQITSKA